jgi:hypothetical protein
VVEVRSTDGFSEHGCAPPKACLNSELQALINYWSTNHSLYRFLPLCKVLMRIIE